MNTLLTSTIKRLNPKSRVECKVVFAEKDIQPIESAVIAKRRQSVTIKGFRTGQAPIELIRKHIGEDQILDDVIRHLLAQELSGILRENNIHPIIPPTIEIISILPLALTITFIEHPEVSLKKIEKIEKHEVNIVDADINRVVDYILKQYGEKELSETFVKEKLGTESVSIFKQEVLKNLQHQGMQQERQRQEHVLLEKIRDATKVELVPELIQEEIRSLKEELMQELSRAGVSYDEWLKNRKKSKEEMEKYFLVKAENRLKIRFGLEKLIEEKKVDATHDEIKRIAPDAKTGDEHYNRAQWQIRVQKVIDDQLN